MTAFIVVVGRLLTTGMAYGKKRMETAEKVGPEVIGGSWDEVLDTVINKQSKGQGYPNKNRILKWSNLTMYVKSYTKNNCKLLDDI